MLIVWKTEMRKEGVTTYIKKLEYKGYIMKIAMKTDGKDAFYGLSRIHLSQF